MIRVGLRTHKLGLKWNLQPKNSNIHFFFSLYYFVNLNTNSFLPLNILLYKLVHCKHYVLPILFRRILHFFSFILSIMGYQYCSEWGKKNKFILHRKHHVVWILFKMTQEKQTFMLHMRKNEFLHKCSENNNEERIFK